MGKLMKKCCNYLIRGIYAGLMIGIGGTIFLSVDNKIMGSFLFSIGLLMICMYNMNLYTGKIGYVVVNKRNYLIELLFTLIGNFIGTYVLALGILNTRFSSIGDKAKVICDMKLNDNLISILILSCLCGVLMYIAVNNYKKHSTSIGKYMGIFMCVMVFILSGFEHSVANMFYFSVSNMLSWNTLLYLFVMVIGNSIGAILISLYDNKINK